MSNARQLAIKTLGLKKESDANDRKIVEKMKHKILYTLIGHEKYQDFKYAIKAAARVLINESFAGEPDKPITDEEILSLEINYKLIGDAYLKCIKDTRETPVTIPLDAPTTSTSSSINDNVQRISWTLVDPQNNEEQQLVEIENDRTFDKTLQSVDDLEIIEKIISHRWKEGTATFKCTYVNLEGDDFKPESLERVLMQPELLKTYLDSCHKRVKKFFCDKHPMVKDIYRKK